MTVANGGHDRPIIEYGPEGGFAVGTIDMLLNLCRKHSLWFLTFGTACCGIELMQFGGPRTDSDRLGIMPRATPRQADVFILAGTISYKMASRIRLLYDQMPDYKYVIAMGSCANTGGLFQDSYSVVKGGDRIVPVDVYLPGCPPRPEALLESLMLIQQKVESEPWLRKAWGKIPPPVDPWPRKECVE